MKIFIAGDSTASIKELDKRPETGWGEKISLYFKEDVTIVNAAQNGRSTKSFLNEGRLKAIEKEFVSGDYLIIQFGHNDEKIENVERYASPKDYQKNLEIFIESAKAKGVTPIILSSVSRRMFLDDKKTLDINAIGIYPRLALEVAKANKVLSFDIFKKSQKLYEELGFEDSEKLFLKLKKGVHSNYPLGIDDNTHFNDLGALIIASIIAEELLITKLPIDKDKLLSLTKIKELIK